MTQLLHAHLIAAVCLTALIATSSGAGTWDYGSHGPSHWAEMFPQFCAGEKQSPIDLSTAESVQQPLLKNLVFSTPASAGSQVTLNLQNDGHKLELSWNPAELDIRMGISKTNLRYTAAQLHWHWGSTDKQGSEHTLNAKSYPAEGHLVFYNHKDYSNFSNAADKPNGLAVLGIFYELSEQDNPLFALLNRALTNDSLVQALGTSQILVNSDFDIFKLLLPSNTNEYFRYDGSLTTPNCYESVLWTVYRQPVPISQTQLAALRRLKFTDNSTMVNNFRPPLPLNPGNVASTPRTVYRTFSAASALSGQPLACLATVAMLLRLAITAVSA